MEVISDGLRGMSDFVICEEVVEHIESQLKNKHCKKCPYEGAGINSGILLYLRKIPLEVKLREERKRLLDKLVERANNYSETVEVPCQDGWHTGDHSTDVIRISYLEIEIELLRDGVEK